MSGKGVKQALSRFTRLVVNSPSIKADATKETLMNGNAAIIVGPGQTRHADGRSVLVPDEVQCKIRTSDLGGRLCIMLAHHGPWEGRLFIFTTMATNGSMSRKVSSCMR